MSTFAELRTETIARGNDHLTTARAGAIVNAACMELDSMFLWPYRENSGEGTAPLEVEDLGVIEAVTNETLNYPLEPREYRNLIQCYGDLSTTGTPIYYYTAEPAGGDPVVATYPTSSDTIGVQYYRQTPELSADGDTPLAPARFHYVYLLIAQRMAFEENLKFGEAQAIQVAIDRAVGIMVNALFTTTIQGPTLVSEVFDALDA